MLQGHGSHSREGKTPFGTYRNDPKFLDRQAWANSVHLDQTAPKGTVSTLFAILSASFGLTLLHGKTTLFKF